MQEYMNRNLSGIALSGIRRVSMYAAAKGNVACLTIGEPDFSTPEAIKAACKAALDRNETYYAPTWGLPRLREKIAAFEEKKHGLRYTADEVLLTAGATESLYLAFCGTCNPGDEVIIPTPAFGLYESLSKVCGAVPVRVETVDDGFQLTPEKLAAAITPKTKAILLNSPNNPTGTVLSRETLRGIRDLVAGKPIFVICDDVYNQLVYGACPSFAAEFPELRKQTIVCQSFSKPYAMTGWRMGYLLADAAVAAPLSVLHQNIMTCLSTPQQYGCMEALDQDISEMLTDYRNRRDYICGRLDAMGLPYVRPQGAFYVFPDFRNYNSDSYALCMEMIDQGGVAGIPGVFFGAEGFMRFSYCYSMEEIKTAMDRLEVFLKNYKK